jgi:hypothetical protein
MVSGARFFNGDLDYSVEGDDLALFQRRLPDGDKLILCL